MKPKTLLTTGNPKTDKGAKYGYLTAVLHLAPATLSGYQVCAMAELAGCIAGCLNTAGRGGIAAGNATFNANGFELPDNRIQRARILRTRYLFENEPAFMAQLVAEISAHVRKAQRAGLIPVIRLNGTSDLDWTRIKTADGRNMFEIFPDVQFYDYTKITKRARLVRPSNYYLAVSWSGASAKYAAMAEHAHEKHGAPLVVVVRNDAQKAQLIADNPRAVDGDQHDLIFKHARDALIVLKAKGRARADSSGFVLDYNAAARAAA